MSASRTSLSEPLDPKPTSHVFRNRLGAYVAHVQAYDAQVRLTVQGHPAGVLMSPSRAQQAGYQA
ncbi:type II toxin-antitoxin system prevent-host-death family antitoxin [Nocardiopsis synnemataformans]|uniref:type II toxin-antitoxin system prevent-host-death family antitoxin n=1 Tax=Nocardiopsis synnemataformans TaxID=61305 RepID=UPI003EBE3409